MSTRWSGLLTALCLLALTLGGAGAARAASVVGGSSIPSDPGPPITLDVSARSVGDTGTGIVRVSNGPNYVVFGNVIAVLVDASGHQARVVAVITRTDNPHLLNQRLLLSTVDNGPAGEEARIDVGHLLTLVPLSPLTDGNITINP